MATGPNITFQKMEIAGVPVVVEHGTDLLKTRLGDLYGHALVDSHGACDDEPLRVVVGMGEGEPARVSNPFIHMIADRHILGNVEDHRMVLCDGRTRATVDYQDQVATLILHSDDPAAVFVAIHRLFPIALGELLRVRGRYPMHGAVVADSRGGVLFLGDSEAGKSTTVYRAMQKGYRYVADDGLIIRQYEDGFFLYPFYREFTLDPRVLSPEDLAHSVGSEPAVDHAKVRLRLPDGSTASECRARRIFLLEKTESHNSSVVPCSGARLIAELHRQHPLMAAYPPVARSHLNALAQLTRECESFTIYSGTDILQSDYMIPWSVC